MIVRSDIPCIGRRRITVESDASEVRLHLTLAHKQGASHLALLRLSREDARTLYQALYEALHGSPSRFWANTKPAFPAPQRTKA